MSGKNTMPSDVAVIIPSYNPDDRMINTVCELIAAGASHIIVVNDGSGKEYDAVFRELAVLSPCTVLAHTENRGKGASIKSALSYCKEHIANCRGAVTVDGDGHHRCRDIVSCAQKMISTGKVILGEREKKDRTISKRGRYGNRITSFAISVVCGFEIRDPLTGLRGIPAKYFSAFLSTKGEAYDFETNMILDFKRKHIPFHSFPIVGEYYPDGKKSHFRPFRDSAKIAAEIIRYFGQQFKYLLSSLASYLFEYLLYRFLLAYCPVVGVTLTNYICRLFSGTLNFLINKNLVFRMKKNNMKTAVKYVAVVILVMLLSTEMIVLVNAVFATEANTVAKFIKLPVDFVMFFFGYWLQKKWVFSVKKKR